jgi:hypothetical protein
MTRRKVWDLTQAILFGTVLLTVARLLGEMGIFFHR